MKTKMLNVLFNYITNSEKTALTSLLGAAIGQAASESNEAFINMILQRGAWTVAIIAGVLTMINLFFPLRSFYDKKQKKDANPGVDKEQS